MFFLNGFHGIISLEVEIMYNILICDDEKDIVAALKIYLSAEIFRRKYQLYARQSEENSVKIDLNSNFRSKLLVTETVNRVFSSAMEGYDENARLKCTVDEVHPAVSLYRIYQQTSLLLSYPIHI